MRGRRSGVGAIDVAVQCRHLTVHPGELDGFDFLPDGFERVVHRSARFTQELLDLLLNGACLPDGFRASSQHRSQLSFHLKLLFQAGNGRLHSGVHFYGEWRGIGCAVGGELYGVHPGQNAWAERKPGSIARYGRDGIFVPQEFRRSIVEIPHPAVHAGGGRENSRHANPIRRNG